MKFFLLGVLFSSLVKFNYAQNLVPNNSFELYDTCPNAEAQIARAVGWTIYSHAGTTPDYYNACDVGGLWCVPNGGGIHQPAHDGNAYGAVVTFGPANAREYVGVQLSQSLIVGQKYFISFYATLGETYGAATPSNKIGIRLSTFPFNQNTPAPTNNFAHLYSSAIINDTSNWIHVSGNIIADSAYYYCIIGNFFDNTNTDTVKWNVNSSVSYYGIDDICISTDSLTCDGTGEAVITPDNNFLCNLSPNPFTTQAILSLPNWNTSDLRLKLTDETGRSGELKYHITSSGKQTAITIDRGNLETGMYFLSIAAGEKQAVVPLVIQ